MAPDVRMVGGSDHLLHVLVRSALPPLQVRYGPIARVGPVIAYPEANGTSYPTVYLALGQDTDLEIVDALNVASMLRCVHAQHAGQG